MERTDDGVTQAEVNLSTFWSLNRRNRVFIAGNGGTSFDGKPISRFVLGPPFRLDAFEVGERTGDHYAAFTVGYLHQIGRLPDFLGGNVHAGTWLENGAAFDSGENADINTHVGVGFVMDTLVGPVVMGTGIGDRRRMARVFRSGLGVWALRGRNPTLFLPESNLSLRAER